MKVSLKIRVRVRVRIRKVVHGVVFLELMHEREHIVLVPLGAAVIKAVPLFHSRPGRRESAPHKRAHAVAIQTFSLVQICDMEQAFSRALNMNQKQQNTHTRRTLSFRRKDKRRALHTDKPKQNNRTAHGGQDRREQNMAGENRTEQKRQTWQTTCGTHDRKTDPTKTEHWIRNLPLPPRSKTRGEILHCWCLASLQVRTPWKKGDRLVRERNCVAYADTTENTIQADGHRVGRDYHAFSSVMSPRLPLSKSLKNLMYSRLTLASVLPGAQDSPLSTPLVLLLSYFGPIVSFLVVVLSLRCLMITFDFDVAVLSWCCRVLSWCVLPLYDIADTTTKGTKNQKTKFQVIRNRQIHIQETKLSAITGWTK